MSQSKSESADPVRRILVGVSGGIAAYKAPELVRRLRERGCQVRVAMTAGALEFISPLTLQAVSGHRVHDRLLDTQAEAGMGHIELARWADDIVIAPATADLIGRVAHGIADDLLTTTVLASEARLWLAPTMNRVMWSSSAVRDNVALLESRGIGMLGPDAGAQACGEEGYGRMLAPEEIVDALLAQGNRLSGKLFVVTAGPTFEALDPVRYIGNRSSGRMGFAVARALAEQGSKVKLIAGPVHLVTPPGVERINVRTAAQMHQAVFDALPADGFVAVAAVADYRPANVSKQKIKRSGESMTLELIPNPDIAHDVAHSKPKPFTVGFAAETCNVAEHARAKLEVKGLDLIVANQVGDDCGFDRCDNALEVHAANETWKLARDTKTNLARRLAEIIASRMGDH